MKKALMLGAMTVVAGAFTTTANAQTGSYTFGTGGGGSYCDGITGGVLSGSEYTAVHNYAACYGSSSYNGLFGGFGGKVSSLGKGTWYQLANSPYTSSALILVYEVNFGKGAKDKGAGWVGYFESTSYGIPFEEFNSGTLIAGYTAAKVGPKHDSTAHAALLKAGLVRK